MSCGWAEAKGKEEDIKNVNQFIRLSIIFFVYIRDRWDYFSWPHKAIVLRPTPPRDTKLITNCLLLKLITIIVIACYMCWNEL